jgi:hypothetical protein
MPGASEAALQDLRMRYRTAHAAYQACVRAVTEATMSGERPSPTLLEREARALAALTKLRTNLLAAMAEHADSPQPPSGQQR